MKKIAVFILIIGVLSSCVSKKIYTELEEKYDKLRGSNEALFSENQELIDQKKALQESKIKLQSEVDNF